MLETILRRIVVVGAFLVLLVPFVVVDTSFFPFIVGKAIAFRVIVGLMLGAWASLAVLNPAYRPRWSPIFIASAVFLGVVCIADAVGVNPWRSFWSNFERMEGFVTIFFVVAYLFVIGSALRSEKLWMRFFNASVVASVVASIMAFVEAAKVPAGQLVRVDATLGNPTYLAVYLLVNIFITALLAYRAFVHDAAKRWIFGLYGLAVIIEIVGLYYTGTRGAFLGLIAGIGLGTIVMLVRGKAYPRARRVAGVIIGLALVGIGAFMTLRHTAFIQENPTFARIANISLADDTVQSRITLWTSIGWKAFVARPLLGWGQDNFIVAFGEYYDPIMYKQEPWFDRAHNVFVDWAMASGGIGLIAYLAIFIACLWVLAKSGLPLPEKAILVGLLGAYACNNLFVFDNLTSYIYCAIFLAYIHFRGVYLDDDASVSTKQPEMQSLVVIGFGVLALALIWFTAVRPMMRSQTLLDALRVDYNQHDPVAALAFFDKALVYGNGTGLEETREQLSQSAIRAINNPDATKEAKDAIVQRALAELTESATAEPDNTRRLFFLAHLLKLMGRFPEAHTVFGQALELNPTRQNFLYEVAQIYLAEGEFQKAIDTFKAAYDASTENDIAFEYYAGAIMYDSRIAEGEGLLMDRFGTTTIDNDLILKAYEKAGRKDKIAQILERTLRDMAPADDASTRVSLALVYLDLGRREDAIAQIEQAAVAKPDFANQADQIIAAIKAGKKIIINQ